MTIIFRAISYALIFGIVTLCGCQQTAPYYEFGQFGKRRCGRVSLLSVSKAKKIKIEPSVLQNIKDAAFTANEIENIKLLLGRVPYLDEFEDTIGCINIIEQRRGMPYTIKVYMRVFFFILKKTGKDNWHIDSVGEYAI